MVPLAPVAIYRRTVHASLTRVWENVLDWEHLPWLHASTFASIRLERRLADGWRAESTLRALPERPFILEVVLDRGTRTYHATTVAGFGAGTDVVTRLEPVDDHATRIAVEFLAPGVAGTQAEAVGAAYVQTYTRLWDEDESMMTRRQMVVDGAAPTSPREVAVGGTTLAFEATCPHWGGPLADAPVHEDGTIVCPWHGYRFDLRSGRQVGGPLCLRLAAPATPAAPRR